MTQPAPSEFFVEDLPRTAAATACPRCKAGGLADPQRASAEWVTCPSCNWTGRILLFRPVSIKPAPPAAAGADDAACAMHPQWRAVGTCAGSGDYVCDLCKIDLDDKTYSAGYLSGAGNELLMKKYKNLVRRADREFALAAIISLPFCTGFSLFIVSVIYYFEMKRISKDGPVAERLVRKNSPSILLGLGLLAVLAFFGMALIGAFVR